MNYKDNMTMKKTILTMALAFAAIVGNAKDIKTVVFSTNPKMNCENCENKITGNMRFEKGIKSIDANHENQTVTIQYDADQTSESKLAEAMEKIGYKTTKIRAYEAEAKQSSCCKKSNEEKKACCQEGQMKAEKKDCCQASSTKEISTNKATTKSSKLKKSNSKTKASKVKASTLTKANKVKKTKTDANTSASAQK